MRMTTALKLLSANFGSAVVGYSIDAREIFAYLIYIDACYNSSSENAIMRGQSRQIDGEYELAEVVLLFGRFLVHFINSRLKLSVKTLFLAISILFIVSIPFSNLCTPRKQLFHIDFFTHRIYAFILTCRRNPSISMDKK